MLMVSASILAANSMNTVTPPSLKGGLDGKNYGNKKTIPLTSGGVLSTNKWATEVVSTSACPSMKSKYPSSEELSCLDGCGAGMELSRSTSAAQRLSQALFPFAAEASASEGLERLRSSFPTLSACLSKNLCKTIESVSS
jgi:hypothetical protein